MSEPAARGLSNADSTSGLLADWNIEDDPCRSVLGLPDPGEPAGGDPGPCPTTVHPDAFAAGLRARRLPGLPGRIQSRRGRGRRFHRTVELANRTGRRDRPPARPAGRMHRPRSRWGTARRTPARAGLPPDRGRSTTFPAWETCSQASGSCESSAAGRSPASTWPRRSAWGGGWWRSRSPGRRGTNRGSSPGSSTRTSSPCTRPTTIPRPAGACSACRSSAGPTSPRCSMPPVACHPPSAPAAAWSRPSTGSAGSSPPRPPERTGSPAARPRAVHPPRRPSASFRGGDPGRPGECRAVERLGAGPGLPVPARPDRRPRADRLRRAVLPAARRRPASTGAPVLPEGHGRPGRGLDRRPPGRRARPRPFARAAPPRPEARQHPAGRRRHPDAPGFQPRRREPAGIARRRGRTRDDRRHAPLHGPRAPRRVPSPRARRPGRRR